MEREASEVIAIALGYQPELDNKILLKEIPHNLIVGHREGKLEWIWKCPPCWPAFRVPEVAMKPAGREMSSVILHKDGPPRSYGNNLPDMICPLV